jgi:HPt (histidine-containing phosphotransfer) domain-containing protein
MEGFLGKPYTSQELWACLLKYFTPVNISVIDKKQQCMEDEILLEQLRRNFVKSNQTIYSDIQEAITNGDMELAERLIHTLKSNAAQIGEDYLSEVAAELEAAFSKRTNCVFNAPGAEQMDALKMSLQSVIQKLSMMLSSVNEPSITVDGVIDREKALELLALLEPMVKSHNLDCMELIDDIRLIPNAGELANQIADIEFAEASLSLEKLINALKGS